LLLGDGRRAVETGFGETGFRLQDAPRLALKAKRALGPDLLESYTVTV
jgi:hypothetical protein